MTPLIVPKVTESTFTFNVRFVLPTFSLEGEMGPNDGEVTGLSLHWPHAVTFKLCFISSNLLVYWRSWQAAPRLFSRGLAPCELGPHLVPLS